MMTKTAVAPAVLKQPRENERIIRDDYTFRIETSREVRDDIEKVEIYVDKEPPFLCAGALGYYWHDWSYYKPGPHQIVVMIKTRHGKMLTIGPRKFYVDLWERPAF